MKKLHEHTNVYKAIGEANRIRILKMLQVRPLCVCEIAEVLNLTSSTVSEHLSILRTNGLIISEKKGKIVFYKHNFNHKNPQLSALKSIIFCSLEDDEIIHLDREKAKKVDCREILARKT